MDNNTILNTLNVPVINNFEHFAEQLSLTKRLLYFLIFKSEKCYKLKTIPKKNGKNRTLHIPQFALKVVQRWILKEILEKIRVSNQSMAFVPKKNGLLTNAQSHKDNVFILEMDLHNFFESIDKKRVFNLFYAIGYNKKVSAMLTNLCTYNNVLPQGAVTSPYIANLIAFHLDKRLNGLCSRRDIVYTRYADDLSFSSNNRSNLNSIEKLVKKIISDEGFEINSQKTRYLSNDVKKTVTGITINNYAVHADKKLKKKIRAMIFYSITNQDYSMNENIKGSIAFVNSIEKVYKEKIIKYIINITKKDYLKSNVYIVNKYNENKLFENLPNMKYEV